MRNVSRSHPSQSVCTYRPVRMYVCQMSRKDTGIELCISHLSKLLFRFLSHAAGGLDGQSGVIIIDRQIFGLMDSLGADKSLQAGKDTSRPNASPLFAATPLNEASTHLYSKRRMQVEQESAMLIREARKQR